MANDKNFVVKNGLDIGTSLIIAGTTVTSSAAELNILDGVTADYTELNLLDTAVSGTIVNSKAVIYGAAGQVNATTLQISGTSITSSAAELNYNDITTLGTVQASKTVTADSSLIVKFPDNAKAVFGDSSDLQIYHDGTDSYINDAGTGNLRLAASQIDLLGGTDGAETMATFVDNGAVTLYYDNASKFATTSTGISVTGDVYATTLTSTGNVVVGGDLTVNGTTTTVNSTIVSIDDKNIELGAVASPSNTTADGGGITLKGLSDKTFNWVNSTGAWTSSEHLAVAAGKTLLVSGSSAGTATITAAATAGTPTLTLPISSGTFARLEDKLSAFAATTSSELASVISDETGTGALVFASSPTLSGTPLAPTASSGTNTTQIATTAFVRGEITAIADTNTTYDISSATTTGGAFLRLTAGGSGSGTDDVKFASGTNVTVAYTDANTITISSSYTDTNTTYSHAAVTTTGGAFLRLAGSDSTNDDVKFASGTAITVSYTNADTITIDHTDTSSLSGAYGTAGIASLTVDGNGHVTAVTTATYLTAQSTDFKTVTVTDTDTGYTWATTGSAVAASNGDTLTIVDGAGIDIDADATSKAIRIQHTDTSTVSNLTATSRTYVSALTFDTYGHVTAYSTATETVSDTNTTYDISSVTTTGGALLRLHGSDSTNDDVKFASGTNVTVAYTDANTITISSSYTDTNTTYDISSVTTTGGALLRLTGSGGAGTDDVKFASGTNVTVAYTDANTITVSSTDTNTTYDISSVTTTGGALLRLTAGGSGSGTDDVKFASGTAVTVTYTDANTITVDHTDTSTLLGAQGSAGIASLTVDTYGHVTAVTTATYLTSQSTDFKTVTVTDTDTGYTWSTTGSAVAASTGDTLTIVDGTGIDIDADATSKAIRIQHTDTSTVANLTATSRTYVSALTFDTYGHVTAYSTASETVTDTNTTYDISAVTTTGGALLRLNASTAVTDDVKFASGTAVTVTYTDANTITVDHTDTSTLLGAQGSAGIAAITVDTYGHVTAVTTATYLTTQSSDFGTFSIGADAGYTWGTANTNTSQVADATGDTLTLVRGLTGSTAGIDLFTNTITGTDAIKIAHADTSALTGAQGSAGIASFTVDEMGHVTAVTTATYLTTQSSDFGTFAIAADAGYTWGVANTNTSQVADATGDTLTLVRGLTGTTAGIDLFTNTIAGTDAIKIAHADTSTLTGAQGSAGIAAITVDEMGHVTAVTTATYLTTQSSDFGTVTVTDTDSGYTWVTTGSAVSDTTGDTLTIVDGGGIDIDVDASSDAIRIQHTDTSTVSNLTATSRTYVTALTFDTYGHVTAYSTAAETVADTTSLPIKDSAGTTQFTATDTTGLRFAGAGIASVTYTSGTQLVTITATEADTLDTVTGRGATTSNNITVGDIAVNGGDITTSQTTFNIANSNATTVGAFNASTALTLGYTGTAASTTNISTGATAALATKTVNIGTGGVATAIANINIGTTVGGTTDITSPAIKLSGLSPTATTATHYYVLTSTNNLLPKTLADTKTEIVTTAAVNSAAATTVGTITSGTWQGTIISPTYGGTGVNNASRTITLNTGNLTLAADAAGSSVTVPASGTLAVTSNKLSVFAATTSSELAGVISDETGTGVLVFGTAPTFTTTIDGGATFGAFASSTALTVGYTGTAASTTNISTGATISGQTKTINIGTGGAAGSTSTINIGVSAGGTTTVNNNLTVGGNLIVNGTTTTVNSTTVTIDDPIFTIGGDTAPTSDDNKDRGIEFRWHNGTAAKVGFFGFDDSTGYFTFIPDATNSAEVFSGTTGTLDVGSITGSAAKWTTARTVTFATGDVTGSFTIDGSADVSNVVLTIAANSVALGTDTTGNYVATVAATAGTGISVSGSGSETAAITIAGIDATSSVKGVASFDATNFTVSTGAVSINTIDGGTY